MWSYRYALYLFNSIFLGKTTLNQFIVKSYRFLLEDNGSKLEIQFILKRNPSYLFINSYLPTLFTMLMSIFSLFLDDQMHFGTTIMLVLTAQLCLYTLFQSSLADIPKTAYLKHIDYWNMMVMMISLTSFFTLLLWEVLQHSKFKMQIKYAMRIAIPLFTLIGNMVYWTSAWVLYFEYTD